ncbi:MAG: hypothetical protein IKW19_08790, partial [Akkermansia sp.]|nr:hypothetical protein [Akkermansia sp.]
KSIDNMQRVCIMMASPTEGDRPKTTNQTITTMTNNNTTTTELDRYAAEQATAFVNVTRKAQKATLQAMLQEAFTLAEGVPNATSRLQELITAYKEADFRDAKNRLQYFIAILQASEFSSIAIYMGWKGNTMKACFYENGRNELSASGGGYNFANNLISRAFNRHKGFLKFLIANPDFPQVSFHAGLPYFEYECLGDWGLCEALKNNGWAIADYHTCYACDYHGTLARVFFSKNKA